MSRRWGLRASLAAAVVLMAAGGAWAAVGTQDEDGVYLGEATHLKGPMSFSGDTATFKEDELPLAVDAGGYAVDRTAGTVTEFTNSGRVLYEVDTTSGAPTSHALVWKASPGATTPVTKTFQVPNDYLRGGTFKVLVGRSGSSGVGTPPAIDFQVFTQGSGEAADTSATNQTPTSLSSTIGFGSPEQKTLSVTTDFDSLAAGDIITVEFWRDNDSSTDDLRLYYAGFAYND